MLSVKCVVCYGARKQRTGINTMQLTATRCNTLQHTATHCNTCVAQLKTNRGKISHKSKSLLHCNNAQNHIVTLCNTLRHTAIHSMIVCVSVCRYRKVQKLLADNLKSEITNKRTQHTATHCNTLQHTATTSGAPASLYHSSILLRRLFDRLQFVS